MIRIIYALLCFISYTICNAQQLDTWLTTECKNSPEQYLQKVKKQVPVSPIGEAGKLYIMGKCYFYLNQEDKALKYYLLSKKKFEEIELEEPAKDLTLEIYLLMSSQENYNKYGNDFLEEYFTYAKKTASNERLAYSWNEFGKNAIAKFDEDSIPRPVILDSAKVIFTKGLLYARKSKNALVIAKLYCNLSALEITRDNNKAGRDYLDEARQFIFKSGDHYELFSNYFNYGISYLYEENYAQAIRWFKKAEAVNIPKFRDKSKRMLYKKLMESYDAVNDQPNRRKYQKLYLDLEKLINDEAQNIAIHETDKKYQTEEKDQQITALQSFKEKFYKNRLIFSILLFLVFLLALYSFVRWKKIDYRKRKLELEKREVQEEKTKIEEKHQKAVDELEKVKNIVTEGFIILNDKTKIYLSDLVYVKAEDHYLHVYGKSGKRNFVRGKLSQLIQELPPNFVKCHRSYIVNTNFIQAYAKGFVTLKTKEEIPLSRNFKF